MPSSNQSTLQAPARNDRPLSDFSRGQKKSRFIEDLTEQPRSVAMNRPVPPPPDYWKARQESHKKKMADPGLSSTPPTPPVRRSQRKVQRKRVPPNAKVAHLPTRQASPSAAEEDERSMLLPPPHLGQTKRDSDASVQSYESFPPFESWAPQRSVLSLCGDSAAAAGRHFSSFVAPERLGTWDGVPSERVPGATKDVMRGFKKVRKVLKMGFFKKK